MSDPSLSWRDFQDKYWNVNEDHPLPVTASATYPLIAGGEYNSTSPTLVNGATDALQLDSRGALKVSITQANNPAVVLSTSDALNNSNQGLVTVGLNSVFNGTTWDRQRGDTNGTYQAGIYIHSPSAVTSGNYSTVRLNRFGQTAAATVNEVQTAADGFSNSSIGFSVAASQLGTATLATNASYVYNGTTWDRTRGDTNGISALPGLSGTFWQYAGVTGGITDTADVAAKAAAGASVRNYVSAIQYLNTAAVASEIVIKDGSTVIWRGYAPASMLTPATVVFPVPLKSTANTAINVAMVTTATATRVSVQGFTGA